MIEEGEDLHEKHNRIAAEVAMMLGREFPPDARMVVLQSIATAILGTLVEGPTRYLVAHAELRHLAQGVGKRLNEAEAGDK